jgi:hypothetical protein
MSGCNGRHSSEFSPELSNAITVSPVPSVKLQSDDV